MSNQEKAYYEITYRDEVVAKIPLKEGQKFDPNHKYLKLTNEFVENNKSIVIFDFLDTYCKNAGNTRKKWKKDNNPYRCTFTNKNGEKWKSKPINYKILNRYINKNRMFKFEHFDFPNYCCDWLDKSVDMTMNFHIPSGRTGMFMKDLSIYQRFGVNITPMLDREGFMNSTFLPQLTFRIIRKRNHLVEYSNKCLTIDWLFDLKDLIVNTISLIDITLNQLYIKAKHNPNSGWNFDEEKLGLKHGRRMMDKLKWVYMITGNQLNIERERVSFNTLRLIRNHLNHFDPPSFCASLEEIADWMNLIIETSTLLYKIRKCANAGLSEELMSLMLQPKIVFCPQEIFSNRVDQNRSIIGYKSAIWKEDADS